MGYGDGVGLWSVQDGSRLAHAHLLGPIAHLLLSIKKRYAATELGSHLVWDLSTFYLPYCDLLRDIWRKVPVTWLRGQAVLSEPAPAHIRKP